MRSLKNPAIFAILVTAVLSNLLIIFPAIIFSGNPAEFYFDFLTLVKPFFAIIFIGFCLATLGALVFKPDKNGIVLSIIATVSVLTWIQGSIIVWDYGVFDGRSIPWEQYSSRGWIDLAIWGTVLLFCIFGGAAVRKTIIRLALLIFAIQMPLALYSVVSSSSTHPATPSATKAHSDLALMAGFSDEWNVLHIVPDGFQSDIFEELVNSNPEYVKQLQGFVFYQQHLGAFPFTHMSIPAMLSGEVYKNEIPIEAHIENTISRNNIFSSAREAGYEVDIVSPSGTLNHLYSKTPRDNLFIIPPYGHIPDLAAQTFDTARILDLSLFRITPHLLKKKIYANQRWFFRSMLEGSNFVELAFFRNLAFMQDLSHEMNNNREEPVYKYLHLTLSHNPMVTAPGCKFAGQVLETNRQTVLLQAGCALKGMIDLFESMKQSGVYENTLILITADHGAWVTPNGITGPISEDKKRIEIVNPALSALSLPLLAVKLPGASNQLQVSYIPTWLPDIAHETKAYLSRKSGEGQTAYEFQSASDPERSRKFYFYEYSSGDWDHQYLNPITEANVTGNPLDRRSWEILINHLPAGQKGTIDPSSGGWTPIISAEIRQPDR